MINVDLELNRLRRSLEVRGFDFEEQEYLVSQAQEDINNSIDNIIARAVEQATVLGIEMDAPDFVSQLEIQEFGGRIQLGTTSGTADFSLPPYPNLNNLLKNPKVAKDGTRYKIIPVGKKSDRSRNKGNFTDLYDVQQQINQEMQENRAIRKEQLADARRATFTGQSANILSGLNRAREFLRNRNAMEEKAEAETTTSEPEFRTATSNQDPTTDWVLPAVDKDLGPALAEINRQIENDINSSITYIISEYERLQ